LSGRDDVLTWNGLHSGRWPDSDRQGYDQRGHTHDEYRRDRASNQSKRSALAIVSADELGCGGVRAGERLGEVVSDSAVREGVVAGTRDVEVGRGHCQRVNGAGAGILSVGARRRR
jgi:hypothetical protein